MNRFAVDNAEDRSAPLWIVTLLAIIYSSVVLVARVFLKAASVGTEDAIIVGAQVIAFGQFGATIHAIKQGVGLTDLSLLGPDATAAVIGSFKASQIMYLIANTLSKLSMVFLVKRIFSHQDSRRAAVFCGTLGAIVAAWGIASTMATSIGCQPVHVMQGDDETCPGAGARWLAVLIPECVIEGAIVALPTLFCSKLQMSLDKKMKVVVAFAFRLLCIFFSAMHYSAYAEVTASDSNAYLSSVMIWQQAGLCYALISATIPVSLQFIGRFATGVSVALSSSHARSRGATYGSRQDGTVTSRKKSKTRADRSEDQEQLTVTPDAMGNFSTVAYRAPERRISLDGIMRHDSITLTYTQPGQA